MPKGVFVGSSFTYGQENCGSITWNPAEHVAQKYESMTDLEREFHDRMVQLSLRSIAHVLAGNMLMPEPGQRAPTKKTPIIRGFLRVGERTRTSTSY